MAQTKRDLYPPSGCSRAVEVDEELAQPVEGACVVLEHVLTVYQIMIIEQRYPNLSKLSFKKKLLL